MMKLTALIGSIPVLLCFVAQNCKEVTGSVVVNEVSDKGTYNTCGGTDDDDGEDFVELYNDGEDDVDLSEYVLHDDKGPDDDDALTFLNGTVISADEYLLLCQEEDFEFKIGGDDTVTLLDAGGTELSTTGVLTDEGTQDLSYQRKDDGTYAYEFPTPGRQNLFDGATWAPTAGPNVDDSSGDDSDSSSDSGSDSSSDDCDGESTLQKFFKGFV